MVPAAELTSRGVIYHVGIRRSRNDKSYVVVFDCVLILIDAAS